MGTHLRVFSESYLMNINMTGFTWFAKFLHPCALDAIGLRIGRVNPLTSGFTTNNITQQYL